MLKIAAGSSPGSRAPTHEGDLRDHLKNGRDLTADTLFPFAQIALVNMATTLHQDVDVEVVGIPVE